MIGDKQLNGMKRTKVTQYCCCIYLIKLLSTENKCGENRSTYFILNLNLTSITLDKDDRGRSLRGPSKVIAIENVDCSKSICTADVVLISSLAEGQTYKSDLRWKLVKVFSKTYLFQTCNYSIRHWEGDNSSRCRNYCYQAQICF